MTDKQYNLRQLKKWRLPYLQKNLLRLYSGPLFDSTKLEKVALQEDLERHIENKEVRATILNGVEKQIRATTWGCPYVGGYCELYLAWIPAQSVAEARESHATL